MMMKRFAALLAPLIIWSCPAVAEKLTWKTDTRFWKDMVELDCAADLAKVDLCEHFVTNLYKSAYGVNIYLTFIDGIRASVGLGSEDPTWLGQSVAVTTDPFDFGGIQCGRSFKPLYAIKRFYETDNGTFLAIRDRTYLVIFRLHADGSSSSIGPENKLISDNQEARALAERDAVNVKCAGE
jgi:hypothetical protein